MSKRLKIPLSKFLAQSRTRNQLKLMRKTILALQTDSIVLNFHNQVDIKTGYYGCRSTPARHAARLYQPKRHPNAQEKTQTLHIFNETLTIIIICIFNCYAK